MTTILTVHGTGSTGLQEGEKWWQKGSPFEAQMREMVEAEAEEDELNWQPVIWDGANSETSRRAAGKELYGKMQELEARGEPYSVIGHSHGGSVISAALIEAAGKKDSLEQMKNWLTVGTPFIKTKREWFLFSRLGLFGKAIYVVLATGPIAFFFILLYELLLQYKLGEETQDYYGGIAVLLMFLIIALVLIHSVFLFFERNSFALYNHQSVIFAKSNYSKRCLPLWHRVDEAIQGLKSLKRIRVSFFSKRFAVGIISFVSIFTLPLILMTSIISTNVRKSSYIALDNSYEYLIKPIEESVSKSQLRFEVIEFFTGRSPEYLSERIGSLENSVIILIFAFLVFVFFYIVFVLFVKYFSISISYVLSLIFNPLTLKQIRATGFGSDTEIDYAIDAQTHPMWMDKGHPSLPEDLANNIQGHADAAAAKAIPKFRSAAASFAMASEKDGKTDMLSEYLTWDELIHTSYFKNPYFVKLVAYGLIQGDGFRASQSFLADPHYANAANWHKEIVGG